MIDINKKYRTRDGRAVRIYAVDGAAPYSVHGAVKIDDRWVGSAWMLDGGYLTSTLQTDKLDLIEVRPRIKREVWVNVYRHDDGYEFATYHNNEIGAESEQGDAMIARVRLKIDCEEGEGL